MNYLTFPRASEREESEYLDDKWRRPLLPDFSLHYKDLKLPPAWEITVNTRR